MKILFFCDYFRLNVQEIFHIIEPVHFFESDEPASYRDELSDILRQIWHHPAQKVEKEDGL